jgi:hypothetical protein
MSAIKYHLMHSISCHILISLYEMSVWHSHVFWKIWKYLSNVYCHTFPTWTLKDGLICYSVLFQHKATMVKQCKIWYRKQFPSSICNVDCEGQESVLCFGCGKWVHSTCTAPNLTQELHGRWSAHGLKFYCQLCCYSGDQFDFQHSLWR